MKRELIQNVQLIPLGENEAIDCSGYLSAVVAIKPKGSGALTIKVTHADEKTGNYTEVPDTGLFVNGTNKVDNVTESDLVTFDLDLIGCKRFVKITFEGDGKGESPAAAVVLGDAANTPVEAIGNLGE